MPRPHLYLLLALAAAYGISHFSDHIDPYHLDVLTGIGINVILAVSLNLVNGYTGQFSLGHAGFMSVGAYLSAAVTVFLGPKLFGDDGGTAFQQCVSQALRAIPPGETASYAEIAKRIGAPTATRAVAQACGANPLAVAIPCHRVVRNDGSISGYRWGVERKHALLQREASQAAAANEVEA